jgi:hypothetical protein
MEAVERQWDLPGVLEQLKAENDVRRRAWPLFLLCAGALVLLTIVNAFVDFSWGYFVPIPIALNVGVFVFLFTCIGVTEKHKAAAIEAAQIKDKRALGYLIEVLDSDDKELVPLARSTALELLADVRPEDAELFDKGHRDSMLWAVNFSKDLEIVTAVLAALRIVGGPECLAMLEHIANEAPMAGDKEHKHKVQELSRLALTDIRLRLARGVIDEKTITAEAKKADALRVVEQSG